MIDRGDAGPRRGRRHESRRERDDGAPYSSRYHWNDAAGAYCRCGRCSRSMLRRVLPRVAYVRRRRHHADVPQVLPEQRDGALAVLDALGIVGNDRQLAPRREVLLHLGGAAPRPLRRRSAATSATRGPRTGRRPTTAAIRRCGRSRSRRVATTTASTRLRCTSATFRRRRSGRSRSVRRSRSNGRRSVPRKSMGGHERGDGQDDLQRRSVGPDPVAVGRPSRGRSRRGGPWRGRDRRPRTRWRSARRTRASWTARWPGMACRDWRTPGR